LRETITIICTAICLTTSDSWATPAKADSNGDAVISWQESKQYLKPCKDVAEDSLPWYDRAHLKFSSSVCKQAIWFDSFFSPDLHDTEIATSLIKIKFKQRWHEERGFRAEPKISAYLNLPNTERNLKLYIESQFSDASDDGVSDDGLVSPSDEKGTAAAVRWTPEQRKAWDMAFDVGARFDGGPDPFTRAIAKFSHPLGNDLVLKLSQELLLELQDSWSETSRLRIDRFQGSRGYRWYSRAKYGDQTDGLEWNIKFGIINKLDSRTTFSYYAEVEGATDDQPGEQSENYKLGLHYRHSFFRPWLFFELEPQLTWPREYDYNITPVILFNLELQLGRKD